MDVVQEHQPNCGRGEGRDFMEFVHDSSEDGEGLKGLTSTVWHAVDLESDEDSDEDEYSMVKIMQKAKQIQDELDRLMVAYTSKGCGQSESDSGSDRDEDDPSGILGIESYSQNAHRDNSFGSEPTSHSGATRRVNEIHEIDFTVNRDGSHPSLLAGSSASDGLLNGPLALGPSHCNVSDDVSSMLLRTPSSLLFEEDRHALNPYVLFQAALSSAVPQGDDSRQKTRRPLMPNRGAMGLAAMEAEGKKRLGLSRGSGGKSAQHLKRSDEAPKSNTNPNESTARYNGRNASCHSARHGLDMAWELTAKGSALSAGSEAHGGNSSNASLSWENRQTSHGKVELASAQSLTATPGICGKQISQSAQHGEYENHRSPIQFKELRMLENEDTFGAGGTTSGGYGIEDMPSRAQPRYDDQDGDERGETSNRTRKGKGRSATLREQVGEGQRLDKGKESMTTSSPALFEPLVFDPHAKANGVQTIFGNSRNRAVMSVSKEDRTPSGSQPVGEGHMTTTFRVKSVVFNDGATFLCGWMDDNGAPCLQRMNASGAVIQNHLETVHDVKNRNPGEKLTCGYARCLRSYVDRGEFAAHVYVKHADYRWVQ